ncbi:Retrovirus-related Pol polyprotein from transposon 17.6 [Acropora cervicornis]|uniref:Retrovirus-related Pol polyprotein from transposon 17.6 n=1 Tax=Acropora cervicornis TaxID=6130 RepID=A0AAD9Q3S6_ACRCE|nr:Retrovirus-related Pol polyprotein from transposon 17.6 [Acropora cervicornis]
MPKPTDVKGVQRFLGLINYLSKFLLKMSELCEPLRVLTLRETEWCWLEAHNKVFQEIKLLVTNSPVLRYYDPTEELTLQCDASEKGLGAALLQQGHPIAFASRALTACEMGYAPIEKELLAVVYGMERFHHYTYGRKVTVNSDHKPRVNCKETPTQGAKETAENVATTPRV